MIQRIWFLSNIYKVPQHVYWQFFGIAGRWSFGVEREASSWESLQQQLVEKIFLFYTSLGKQLLSWQRVTVELKSDCEEDPLWCLPCAVAAAVPVVGDEKSQCFTWAKSSFWFSCSLPVWPWQLAQPLRATWVPTGKVLMWCEQHCHQMNAHEAKEFFHQKEGFPSVLQKIN